jgi:hypothetical protein
LNSSCGAATSYIRPELTWNIRRSLAATMPPTLVAA